MRAAEPRPEERFRGQPPGAERNSGRTGGRGTADLSGGVLEMNPAPRSCQQACHSKGLLQGQGSSLSFDCRTVCPSPPCTKVGWPRERTAPGDDHNRRRMGDTGGMPCDRSRRAFRGGRGAESCEGGLRGLPGPHGVSGACPRQPCRARHLGRNDGARETRTAAAKADGHVLASPAGDRARRARPAGQGRPAVRRHRTPAQDRVNEAQDGGCCPLRRGPGPCRAATRCPRRGPR